MSIQALAAVIERSESRLSARCALMSIANHLNAQGVGWCAIDTIRHEARLSTRGVQTAIRQLEELGELKVRLNEGRGGTNVYVLTLMADVQTPAKFAPRKVRPDSAPKPLEPLVTSSSVPKTSTGSSLSSAKRERNPQFDALAEIEGLNLQELDTGSSARLAVALAKIRKITPDLTPGEIVRRAKNYGTHFPDATLTAGALAKWWPRLGEPARNGHHEETMSERFERLGLQ